MLLDVCHPLLTGATCALNENSISQTIAIDRADDSDESHNFPIFFAADWINCCKIWTEETSICVHKAHDAARCIPEKGFSALIPARYCSANELMHNGVHWTQRNPVTHSICPQFCNNPPTVLINNDLRTAESVEGHQLVFLASLKHVSLLRQQFNNAWLAGAQSITFSSNSHHRYPLYSEQLLGHLSNAIHKMQKWAPAYERLEEVSQNGDICAVLAEVVWECFNNIPWDSSIPGLGQAVSLHTQDLTSLLSTDWLNDELINGGLNFIMRQLPVDTYVRLMNCYSIEVLKNARKRGKIKATYLWGINIAIHIGDVDELYLPVNISRCHWTVLKIDLCEFTYCYADSLDADAEPPVEIIDLLEWWLNQIQAEGEVVNRNVTGTIRLIPLESQFVVARQTDSHSCRVCVISTIASEVLKYELWTKETSHQHHLEWFL